MPMILGVDPGSVNCGFMVIKREGSSVRYVDACLLKMSSKTPLDERLGQIALTTRRLVERYPIEWAGVENQYVGVSSKSAITLAKAAGAAIGAIAAVSQDEKRTIGIQEIAPTSMKVRVAGSGRAGKELVCSMVRAQVSGVPEDLSVDVLEAGGMALAVDTGKLKEIRETHQLNALNA